MRGEPVNRGSGGSIFAFIGSLLAFYLATRHPDWSWWGVILKTLCGWWYVAWHFAFH